MNIPSLDQFIHNTLGKQFCTNAWVQEEGFHGLYVRLNPRYINGKYCYPVLDIANLEAEKPGNGTFTNLIARLRKDFPILSLYVENVLEERFANKLEKMGFEKVVTEHPCCFFMEATEVYIKPL